MNELAKVAQEAFAEHGLDQWRPEQEPSFGEWYVQQVAMRELLLEQVKAQYNKIANRLEGELHWLQLGYDGGFQAEVQKRLAAQHGKGKYIDYLAGRAGYREAPGKVEVTDEEKLLPWLREHRPDGTEAVVTHKIKKKVIKEHIVETGEVPPGVEYTEPADKFYLKTTTTNITKG